MRGYNRELVAALSAARLEYSTPVLRFHPLAEAMHAQTSALLGLPGSLNHDFPSSSANSTKASSAKAIFAPMANRVSAALLLRLKIKGRG
jgi:hypothetical protein